MKKTKKTKKTPKITLADIRLQSFLDTLTNNSTAKQEVNGSLRNPRSQYNVQQELLATRRKQHNV